VGGYQGKSQPKGFSLRRQLLQVGLTDLGPGVVVRVKDSKLSFPHNLYRKAHETRFALVLSNDQLCTCKHTPLIVIVPMTHKTDIRSETDVLVRKTAENGLDCDSLVQLHLIQPLLKTEVVTKKGVLGATDWDNVIERLVWMTDRA
jgi:mRNA-degrading endonuclease toxin of MazEF toxin-antitoxin module